jgi:hypothetical protein
MKRTPKKMPMRSTTSVGMRRVLSMGGMTPKPKTIFARPTNNPFDFVPLTDLEAT